MTIKRFILHLLAMVISVALVLFIVLMWLKIYTHHGQKLELPDYREMFIDDAIKDARKKSFEILVNDSIFKVGVPGGMIINQNPIAGSKVKEGRKVYVDVSRYNATTNIMKDLPIMYGREYESVKRSLSHLEIDCEIKSYLHDAGESEHILEVWYEGKQIDGKAGRNNDVEIETGGTLSFVLSKKEGGSIRIPDLTCERLGNAKWKLQVSRLKLGNIEKSGLITVPLDSAYIIQQSPSYSDSTTIQMGQSIAVKIQQEKPEICK